MRELLIIHTIEMKEVASDLPGVDGVEEEAERDEGVGDDDEEAEDLRPGQHDDQDELEHVHQVVH